MRRLLACAALALVLSAQAAVAAPTALFQYFLFSDEDGDDAITCGDVVNVILTISDSPNPYLLENAVLEIPIPAGSAVVRGSIVANNVKGGAGVVAGNGAGDPTIRIEYGRIDSVLPSGASASYQLRIDKPNGTAVLAWQGSLTSSNNPPIPTDDINTPGPPDPVEIFFPPCAPLPPDADLSLTKSDGGARLAPGGVVAYTLGYFNLGPAPTAANLTEIVPPLTSFDGAASSPGWSCSPSTGPGSTCALALGQVAAFTGGSRLFALRLAPDVPDDLAVITNTATIGGAAPDQNSANNAAMDSTPVDLGVPDLAVSKTLASGSGVPGSVLIYDLAVTNLGNRTAQSVELSETVPLLTSFEPSASSTGWSWQLARGGCSLRASGRGGPGRRHRLATFRRTHRQPAACRRAGHRQHGLRLDDHTGKPHRERLLDDLDPPRRRTGPASDEGA